MFREQWSMGISPTPSELAHFPSPQIIVAIFCTVLNVTFTLDCCACFWDITHTHLQMKIRMNYFSHLKLIPGNYKIKRPQVKLWHTYKQLWARIQDVLCFFCISYSWDRISCILVWLQVYCISMESLELLSCLFYLISARIIILCHQTWLRNRTFWSIQKFSWV